MSIQTIITSFLPGQMHGVQDSPVGLMAGLMLSSTESVFYCMSVYFGSVGIQKTRYTLTGALVATLAGMAASVWIVTCVM